jgi:hypothetical protein
LQWITPPLLIALLEKRRIHGISGGFAWKDATREMKRRMERRVIMKQNQGLTFEVVKGVLERSTLEAFMSKQSVEAWQRMVFMKGQKEGELLVAGPADLSDIYELIDQEKEARQGTLSVIIGCRIKGEECYTKIDYEKGRPSAPYSAFYEPGQECICTD